MEEKEKIMKKLLESIGSFFFIPFFGCVLIKGSVKEKENERKKITGTNSLELIFFTNFLFPLQIPNFSSKSWIDREITSSKVSKTLLICWYPL